MTRAGVSAAERILGGQTRAEYRFSFTGRAKRRRDDFEMALIVVFNRSSRGTTRLGPRARRGTGIETIA